MCKAMIPTYLTYGAEHRNRLYGQLKGVGLDVNGYTTYGRDRLNSTKKIIVNNNIFKVVDKLKYLGVTFTSDNRR